MNEGSREARDEDSEANDNIAIKKVLQDKRFKVCVLR